MKITSGSIDLSHRPATPGEAAWQAADAIRALNHLTLVTTDPHAGYLGPDDVASVIGGLHTLAERLPQALRQASSWLTSQHHHDRISHDRISHDRISHDQQPSPDHPSGTRPHSEPGTDVQEVAFVSAAVTGLLADLDAAAHLAVELAGTLRTARTVSAHLTGTERRPARHPGQP